MAGASSPGGPVAIKVLSGGAMRPLFAEAVPLFERGGAKADIRFALTSVLAREIAAGAEFDIAVLPRPELDALTDTGGIVPGTQCDLARSAVGLCVPAGAPRPDIGSVAALKRTLLEAASLGYSDGPSGAYVAGLLVRLGIAEAMKARTRLTSAPVAELVAKGEAAIGIQQIVAILPIGGADLVGPLPAELQNVIVYAAGLSVRAAKSAPAQAFVALMRGPEVARIMRAKGLEPG